MKALHTQLALWLVILIGLASFQAVPRAYAQDGAAMTAAEAAGRAAIERKLSAVVDINAVDRPLDSLIRMLCAQAGVNVIMNPKGLDGNITMNFEDISIKVALDNMLKVNGYSYVIEGEENLVRIVPAAQVGIEEVETVTTAIAINWVAATEVQSTLDQFKSQHGMVVADAQSNTLIITETPPQLEQMRLLIEEIDQPERQVLIEARLVEFQIGALRELGSNLNLSQMDEDGSSLATRPYNYVTTNDDGVPEITEVDFPAEGIWSDQIPLRDAAYKIAFGETVGIFGSQYNLGALFSLYEDRNIIEILAAPQVVTLNNQMAEIEILQQIPYIEVGQTQAGTSQDVQFEEAGVNIQVTPSITPNHYVRMNVVTEQMIETEKLFGIPVIDERRANTNVIVASKETVMIGGLRELRLGDQVTGMPWFHQIPVLGWLFKQKVNDQEKTRLFLFVTPSVLEDIQLTSEQKGFYDRIDTKWELPDYFFDDVKTPEDMD